MALTNLAVFGGAFFTPILVGKITHTLGWWWSFYFVTIFIGVCLPLLFFYVPETAYRRSTHLNTDLASTDDLQPLSKPQESGREANNSTEIEPNTAADTTQGEVEKGVPEHGSQPVLNGHHFAGADTPFKTYKEKLLPFSGRKTDDNFFKLFLRPFPLFVHPAIFWACLIQGTMIGWTVFIGIMLAAIFIGPPLFWGEVNTGYAYTGAFLGSVIGFLIAGGLADWSAKYMTRKNNGIYEPEFRIILVIPQTIFGCTGLYLFGVVCSNPTHYSWVWSVFAFGLQVGGMVIGAVAASLYIVDAHREYITSLMLQSLTIQRGHCHRSLHLHSHIQGKTSNQSLKLPTDFRRTSSLSA
jgi:MFS family permease